MNIYNFPFNALQIGEEDIPSETGTEASDAAFGGYLRERIRRLLTDISSRDIEVKGSCVILDGHVEKNVLQLGKVNLEIGPQIAGIMHKAEQFAVFAVTVGEEFETYREFSSGNNDVLDDYLLNAIGNLMVEKAEHLLEIGLEKEMKGMPHTRRFSPGCCRWPLSDQEKVLGLLANPCGIRLTDYYFMIPEKSVSGIIGFGEGVETAVSECELCELRTVCYKSNFKNHK